METKPGKAFSSIKKGLSEALEFAVENESDAIAHKFTGAEGKERLESDFERNEDNIDDSNN
ncbi:MAG: hypothetical protein U1B30_05385 [Pseudomonadota bacterium]|nr:hypothetical protein [Pseudomonadota bacterium]